MVKQSCFDPTSDVCNIYASLLSENNINEGKLLIPYFLLHCHQKLSRFVALSFFDMQHSKILANFYFHEVNGRCQSKLLLLILNYAFYTCIVHRRNENTSQKMIVWIFVSIILQIWSHHFHSLSIWLFTSLSATNWILVSFTKSVFNLEFWRETVVGRVC